MIKQLRVIIIKIVGATEGEEETDGHEGTHTHRKRGDGLITTISMVGNRRGIENVNEKSGT